MRKQRYHSAPMLSRFVSRRVKKKVSAYEVGVVHPTQLLANRHLVKLGLIKKKERKRCPLLIAATPQEIRRPYRKKRAHCEERQSGVRAYAAIAEIAVTQIKH
ncbi:hypothetical protein EVAR_50895_1 [Eumeta japonica]|uniref:Uncharacterized protein n=1 Tax=Eumeta variegata TaxID=151549 RepID=A0A4C1YB68_EUMVA|nr:hypothetical protein EVAR_50895_1 [Eumeta japonica]